MLRISTITLVAGLALLASPLRAEKLSPGAYEYQQSCAACHGSNARGGGQLSEVLSVKVPDLTTLSKNNNGVFPFERIYRVIDGRQSVKGHGIGEMPVWGSRYREQATRPYSSELLDEQTIKLMVRTRILALIDYLYSKQRK